MAWLDVLSGGRLEMGLVKGAPYEIAPANSNPANLMPLLGGARPDPEGDVDDRRPVQLGGRILPLPQRQHLAAAVSAAASAGMPAPATRSRGVGAVSAVWLGTAFDRGGTMTAASAWRAA